MNYRLSTARLLAATYGDKFDPADRATPDVLAESLPGAPQLIIALTNFVRGWNSGNVNSAEDAMEAAVQAASQQLMVGTTKYTLSADPDAYKPIYDDNGNEIGHDSVAYVYANGKPLTIELTDPSGGKIGLVGCVFLEVVPA